MARNYNTPSPKNPTSRIDGGIASSNGMANVGKDYQMMERQKGVQMTERPARTTPAAPRAAVRPTKPAPRPVRKLT